MKRPLRGLRLEHSVTDKVVNNYLRSLNCPRSLTICILLRYKEFDQIADLDCNPNDFSNAEAFRDAYLASSYLSKSNFLPLKRDREALAKEKFFKSELKCSETNTKWKSRETFSFRDWHYISCIANKIYSILGASPNIEDVVNASSWGPGASTSIKRRDASSYKKFLSERGITADALDVVPFISKFYPLIEDKPFCVEHGDKLVVVPKNCKIDRVILIQPGWNLWFQKGIGKVIRKKLLRSGLDLNNADKYNQWMARESSKTGSHATVDFSSASDQIAIEPIRELLPPDWFRLLDFFRSKRSCDASVTWNKFSSMGNGFTFELETLVFYASACVACNTSGVDDSTVSVFGDDVIIPKEALDSFRHISELLGFTFNPEKTFSQGSFRESCGAHFYDGIDCKPVFLKEKISDVQSCYKHHNAIRRLSRRIGILSCDNRFRSICSLIQRFVPVRYRLRVPDGFGEVGFISNFDESTPNRLRHGFEGYSFRAAIDIPVSLESEELPILMVRLTERSDTSRRNSYEIKSRTRKILTNLSCSEWYDLGPWL